jgi:hypothetical protein
VPISPGRAALLPDATLPLVYFAGAHVALALAAGLLLVDPHLPGAFHYHPRMIAVVHLVTLGWISASILGAFYIVAPLAFGMPFAARRADALACVSFWAGTLGMVLGFWWAAYALVGLASLAVLAAVAIVAVRAIRGLRAARMPFGVSLHIALAFANMLLAGSAGLLMALGRGWGFATWSPLAAAAAHAHLAVLGWGVMMIVGVSYRLVPMFLPAAMPTGRALAWSAVLLEIGTLGIAWALVIAQTIAPWALVVVAAFVAFLRQVRGILGDRRPRPKDLHGRDWSTWQTHAAMLYLVIAVALGLWIVLAASSPALVWAYGVTGILGFVAQMVVGIQGRLLPMHAWYRELARLEGTPPARSAHRLADGRATLTIFLMWAVAVPLLTGGLIGQSPTTIAIAAGLLLASSVVQAWHMARIARAASAPA